MKQLLLITLGTVLLWACKEKTTPKEDDASYVSNAPAFDPSAAFYKKFKGTNDDGPIVMTITRPLINNKADTLLDIRIDSLKKENGITGCKARINAKGHFESIPDEYGNPPAVSLNADFIDASSITVNFYTNSTNKKTKMELRELKQPLRIVPLHYHNEGKSGDEEEGMPECNSYITLDVLHFSSDSKGVNTDGINSFIDKKIMEGSKFRSLEKYVANSIPYGWETWGMDADFPAKGIVSLSFQVSTYGCGAAHEQYGTRYSNFDFSLGRALVFKDIFSKENMVKLEKLILPKFEKENGTEYKQFTKFYIPDNFLMEKKGIRFYFPYYEFGSFAGGNKELFVAYSEMNELMEKGFRDKLLE